MRRARAEGGGPAKLRLAGAPLTCLRRCQASRSPSGCGAGAEGGGLGFSQTVLEGMGVLLGGLGLGGPVGRAGARGVKDLAEMGGPKSHCLVPPRGIFLANAALCCPCRVSPSAEPPP